MSFVGVLPAMKSVFGLFCEDIRSVSGLYDNLLECMATCHSLTVINGRLMGDNQDLQIFNSTGWSYEISSEIKGIVKENREGITSMGDVSLVEMRHELGIIHIFYFTSSLKRMGVIVKDMNHEKLFFYIKGAPEVILNRCTAQSLPMDLSLIHI